jgi:hypothetical protein
LVAFAATAFDALAVGALATSAGFVFGVHGFHDLLLGIRRDAAEQRLSLVPVGRSTVMERFFAGIRVELAAAARSKLADRRDPSAWNGV